MKWYAFIYFLILNSMSTSASETKIKLDSKTSLKFDDQEWSYQYVKELSQITPHFLENKKSRDLKVIIQKETHLLDKNSKSKLIATKCEEANLIYQNSNQGSAKSIKIKNKDVCLVQLITKDKVNNQILYPVNFSKNSYELMSLAWKGTAEKDLEKVKELAGENL